MTQRFAPITCKIIAIRQDSIIIDIENVEYRIGIALLHEWDRLAIILGNAELGKITLIRIIDWKVDQIKRLA